MKYLPPIVGALLGLGFVFFGVMFFFMPAEAKTAQGAANDAEALGIALWNTGYMTFVKGFEILGGVLTAIPKTRNLGLLILGPILVNIIAFTVVTGGVAALFGAGSILLILLCLMAVTLLWADRRRWLGLLRGTARI